MTPTVKLILILFGLAYLISPVDFIPDLLLPWVGWIDDGLVLWCVYYLIRYGELPWFLFKRPVKSRPVKGRPKKGKPAGPGKSAAGRNRTGKKAGNRTVPPESGQSNRRRTQEKTQSTAKKSFKDSPNSPYKILGISPQASWEEIHSAYREKIKQYHPDKLSHLGEEFSSLANEKFLEIQAAYNRLKTRHKKS